MSFIRLFMSCSWPPEHSPGDASLPPCFPASEGCSISQHAAWKANVCPGCTPVFGFKGGSRGPEVTMPWEQISLVTFLSFTCPVHATLSGVGQREGRRKEGELEREESGRVGENKTGCCFYYLQVFWATEQTQIHGWFKRAELYALLWGTQLAEECRRIKPTSSR